MNIELEKFNKIFENIDKDKREVVDNLIINACFMSAELKKLREDIEVNGCVEEYKNGNNQYGRKKSSAVEVYNSMIKNYSAVIKQLLDLLPDGGKEQEELNELFVR